MIRSPSRQVYTPGWLTTTVGSATKKAMLDEASSTLAGVAMAAVSRWRPLGQP